MPHKWVRTKADFVRRYSAGEFGNASPTWNDLTDWGTAKPWKTFGKKQLYHIRNRIAGGATWYNVPASKMLLQWVRACDEVESPSLLYISAMAPTERTILQGEVSREPGGLRLLYSTVRKPMREALAESSREVKGLEALVILGTALNEKSLEWLTYLLDEYPDHVVEFSAYEIEWGTVEGYNTVWWEVRLY